MLPLKNNTLGLIFEFSRFLEHERFAKGKISLHEYVINDAGTLRWFEANNLRLGGSQIPNFLFDSPSSSVSGFLVGYHLALNQKIELYTLPLAHQADLQKLQLILLREGIISEQEGDRLVIREKRFQERYDWLFARCGICPWPSSWSAPAPIGFENTTLTIQEETPSQEVCDIQVEDASGFVANGLYVASS